MQNFDYIQITIIIVSLVIAIIGHEISHGAMAYYFKDDTAKNLGRLSINPIKHVDLVGTIIVPLALYISQVGFIFGWAKPVPVNMNKVYFQGGYKACILVALAGIIYNLALGFIIYLIAKNFMISFGIRYLNDFLFFLIYVNVILAIFNLYPIPPLDGSKALAYFSSSLGFKQIEIFFNKYERYGFVVLIIIFATPLDEYFFMPLRFISNFILSSMLS